MAGIKFWKEWAKPYQILYLSVLSIVFLLFIIYLIAYQRGVENIIEWQTSNTIDHIKYFIKEFDLGIFKIQVPAFTYVIEKAFKPGDSTLSLLIAHIYFFVIFFCLVILNTILTSLKRTYFLVGTAMLIISLLLYKFELLGIFGIYNNFILASIILFLVGISYYFHAFNSDASFLKRLVTFILAYSVIAFFSYAFADEQLPLSGLSHHSVLFMGILTIAFIIMVSHEIIFGFLFLVTYSANPATRNTLLNFFIVCFLYFLCLFLLYFNNIGVLDIEIFGTDAFLILPFSIAIGIFGFRAREFTYSHILNSGFLASLLYITLAVVCFSTLTFVFLNYNDPAIEAFEDFILFSHIGIGLIFFIYIMANFGPLLGKNLNVYKVVYKPARFPFYLVRLGGIMIIVAFLAKAGFHQIYQGLSGYFNTLADQSSLQNNQALALEYYKLGKEYDPFNHKSNYRLGELYLNQNKQEEGAFYLQETFKRKSSPQAYVKVADIYLKNDLYFDAIYTLRNGTKAFPQDEHLFNNLSLLYNKTALADSAFIFLTTARNLSNKDDVTNTNYWSFLAKNRHLIPLNLDSISSLEKPSDYPPTLNNQIALFNLLNKKFDGKLPEKVLNDTSFTDEKFSLLSNYCLNKIDQEDSLVIPLLNQSQKDFQENLLLLKGLINYYHFNKKEAWFLLNKLKVEGVTNVGYYNLLLGIWAMENEAFHLATDYFNSALEKGNKEAFLYRAIAWSEIGNQQEAIAAWENVIQLKDPQTQKIAVAMKGILEEKDFSQFFQLNDELKYQAIRFRFNDLSAEQRDALSQNISNLNIRNNARLLEAEKAFERGDDSSSEKIIQDLKTQKIQDTIILGKLNTLALKISFNETQSSTLEEHLRKSFIPKNYWPYFFARSYEINKNDKQGEAMYKKALNAAPFDRKVVEDAVIFFKKIHKGEEAYNIALASAQLNPYSSKLLELYIMESLNVNLINYANDGMNKLREISSPEEYSAFEKVFIEKRKLKESSAEDWQ